MAGQTLVVMDRSEAVIQPGQPPAQMAAYLLDIPDGGSAVAVAAEFAQTHAFPVGTTARIIDLTSVTMLTFRLDSQWVQLP